MPVLVPVPSPVSVTGPTFDELRIVNMNGTVIQDLQNFQLTQVEWQLSNMGLLQFTVATDEPTFAPYGQITATHEIQYFRRGLLYWWGVIVDTELQGDGSTTQVTCYGLLWYAHKRFFGKANRVNWLTGYALETGFNYPVTRWSAVGGCTATFPIPAIPVIGQAPAGTGGASAADLGAGRFTMVQLAGADNTNLAAGLNAYYKQRVTFPTGPWTPQSPGLVFTAYYNALAFTGPANKSTALGAQQSGLWMQLYEIDGVTPIYINGLTGAAGKKSGQAISQAQITTATPTSQLVRLQVGLVPPNRPFIAELRMYAPGGKIQWGGMSLTQQDGYYSNTAGEAENIIVQRMAQIGMQPSSLGGDNLSQMDNTKTDLNMGFNCPGMNQLRTCSYPYANHANILDSLTDWTAEYQGLDMEIMFQDAHHRTFTTWGTASKGRKGVFQSSVQGQANGTGQGLALVFNPLLASAQFSANAENGASNVLEIGVDDSTASDQGSANVEGGYIDEDNFGGIDIEIVETAPNDITIAALGPLAKQRQRTVNGTPLAPVIRTRADDPTFGPIYIGAPGLHVGDTVLVFGNYGWIALNGVVMRVTQIDLYPSDDGDVVDFTLGLPDPYAGVPSPV